MTEISEAIDQLLDRLNTRKFKAVNSTREQLFKAVDAPALKPLPASRYTFAEWRSAKVNIDYHISVAKHLYSVPYQLAGEQLDVRLTATTVEVFYKNRRVASHIRSYREGGVTTLDRAYARQPSQVPGVDAITHHQLGRAQRTEATAALVENIMRTKPASRNGLWFLFGMIRLGKEFGAERLEAACARALKAKAYSYKSVKSILASGLDKKAANRPLRSLPLQSTQISGAKTTTRPRRTIMLIRTDYRQTLRNEARRDGSCGPRANNRTDGALAFFEERLGLIVDRQWDLKETRGLRRRLQVAKLRQPSAIEDIDFHPARGLDKAAMLSLAECEFIESHSNII